ncbi:hypothetical protein Rsub_12691 [Raphidocelis subcapitata]|uniref:Thioesterase domain-containing protein n=1 Tax=Raphidocelis subcapitata TaxID=307507 RepID=A0A2V0PRI9_9CHLO|nr:hypothetical protein Rsub_12691 [Raphidocelis subcapitata]|eukprot:GBF99895.1 hypothetical protein Rsub_12691 [Raphidocelis subcapitata]
MQPAARVAGALLARAAAAGRHAAPRAAPPLAPAPPPGAAAAAALSTSAPPRTGHVINPSDLRPGAESGPDGAALPVQEAYTPESACFGCGPSSEDGLRLRSFRIANGLEARVTLGQQYCAFPGIVSGGVLSTLLDCHGNWTAAVALMDRGHLAVPPLTLTASILITFREPAPPDTPLVVRSTVVEVKEGGQPGVGKASVEVDVSILQAAPEGGGGAEKLLATATAIFKKLGAARAL